MNLSEQGLVQLFILGVIMGLAISSGIYILLSYRVRRIKRMYESEVQRTKDELLALASHQLRTPASAVKQYLGILTAGIVGDLSADQRSIALKAEEANERQMNIINDLLYVSKADAGQLVIEPRRVNLTELVQKGVDACSEQAAQKAVKVLFGSRRPHYVVADDRYVSMLIDNMLSNAIKYSYPSSSVRVTLASSRTAAMIAVRDKGVGIDPRDHETVFGKFTRVDNPLSHSEGGSGLGLFLARQLARAHGGDVTVVSRLGKGSVFTCELPKKLVINEAIVKLDPTYRKKFKNRIGKS